VNLKFVRTATSIVVIFALGFVAGQITFSIDQQAKARARHVTMVEGALKTKEELRQLDQLRELGYVDGSVDERAEIRGVEIHDRERAFPGVNFYSSRIRTSARLIDNDGVELHSWSYPGTDGWEHAHLLPSGDLLVVVNEQGVFKLDKDSKLLWRHETGAHHDLDVHPSGDIYALSNVKRPRPEIHPEVQVVEDYVEVLSPDGKLERKISILETMRQSDYSFLMVSPQHLPSGQREGDNLRLDLLHTNHVQVFDGSLAHRSPLFREGNLLVSMRTINTIAIIDPETLDVVWAWGPTNLHRQHHPTLIDNGNIIIFDNGHSRSQIVEVDPLTFEVEWRYAPRGNFISRYRGSVQRLANGNSLVTESDRGYVFELTPDHDIVWRFANPDVNQDNYRIAIWRMTRFARDELDFVD
jgi:hypothetical protein